MPVHGAKLRVDEDFSFWSFRRFFEVNDCVVVALNPLIRYRSAAHNANRLFTRGFSWLTLRAVQSCALP
jgi:hypothetical protein